MAHEITESDNVVLTAQPAWHGLGLVVENAPNASEALRLAKLDWTVEPWPLSCTNGESRIAVQDTVANVRTDTSTVLGIVGKDWTAFQNADMAAFCEGLVENDDTVKIESAGSIRGGQKVWFLVRGESFSVRSSRDEIKPYICVSNGFDGKTGFRCTPTTVRVVCSNTLHMVIPRLDNEGRLRKTVDQSYACNHVGDLLLRVAEAKAALGLYKTSLVEHRTLLDTLAARDVNSETVKRFFLECYVNDFGAFADVPTTAKEERARVKAIDGLHTYLHRFEKEIGFAGTNRWAMLNAYTGFVQHDRSRASDERKISMNLFGVNADRSSHAFGLALAV